MTDESESPKTSRKRFVLFVALVFVLAFGARLLYWSDLRVEATRVEWAVTAGYKHNARLLVQEGLPSLWSTSSAWSSPRMLLHPPGYAIILSLIFRVFGESDAAIQIFQLTCDAVGAVVVLLIAAELFPFGVALLAGLLVALAPQFDWHTLVLLPDSLAALPILLAVYWLVRAFRNPRLITVLAAGACVGLSCWLRSNAMFLAPFLAIAFPLLYPRGRRLKLAAAFLGGTILIIAPLTIRNAVVYGYFIPLSLNAGSTLITGIGVADKEGKFGMPKTDLSLLKMEAETYHRPEYAIHLFDPDPVKRERDRLARGAAVIKSHPVWFLGVMIQRVASMMRLERVRLVATTPAVTHSLFVEDGRQPSWLSSPAELAANGAVVSPQAKVSLDPEGRELRLTGDNSKYGKQFITAAVPVRKNTDYVLVFPFAIEQGRMNVNVTSTDSGRVYVSTIIEPLEGKSPDAQLVEPVKLPFVSDADDHVRLEFGNEAAASNSLLRVGEVRLYDLGPASFTWTRYPRFVIRIAQTLFKTAVMLPLVFLGAALLAKARRRRELAILLAVPVYYFIFQSPLRTEHRYVLALQYFLLILVALAIYRAGCWLWQRFGKRQILRQDLQDSQDT
jgi:hypothetical protein